MIKTENLDFWIQNDYNVLFTGLHGTGKTTIVKEAFERNNLKWRYYSASTMDPWVDLVGVPKEHKNEDGSSYLDLVRPKEFQEDAVEALFFDEFNRSVKKVRNAVMELLQFKSINGKRFPSLRLIWAAINPEDEEGEYDVERLDPAQEDRFQIKVTIPYKPHKPYFSDKYGEGSAKAAISWWHDLPNDQKKQVSPRRLDYALDVLNKGGDIRYVLPVSSNVSKLITTLETGPIAEKLKELRESEDLEAAREFLASENNYMASIDHITKSVPNMDFFLECLPNEKLSLLLAEKDSVLQSVLYRVDHCDKFRNIVQEIIIAGTNTKLANRIVKYAEKHKLAGFEGATGLTTLGLKPIKPYHSNGTMAVYSGILAEARKISGLDNTHWYMSTNTSDRKTAFYSIRDNIPECITTAMALDTLSILSHIASKSQATTIIGMKGFIGVCNHCIYTISKTDPSWTVIMQKYSQQLGPLVKKFKTHSKLGPKLYVPIKDKELVWYSDMGKKL